MSLDGSTMDGADEEVSAKAFGRPTPSPGQRAFPQLRFVSMVENGTRVLFGTPMGCYGTGEWELAKGTRKHLSPGRLCLADRLLEGVAGAEPIYRLLTTILDPEKAPAQELAALRVEDDPDRWPSSITGAVPVASNAR